MTFVKTLLPDLVIDSVTEMDFSQSPLKNVKHIVLDVDHTLVIRKGSVIDQQLKEFLVKLKQNNTVEAIFLASNSRRNLTSIANEIGATVIPTKGYLFKPRGAYFRRLLREVGVNPERVAMIGDRLLTDILGGNRAGMVTVLVSPIGPDSLLGRLILRRQFGRWYLRWFGGQNK